MTPISTKIIKSIKLEKCDKFIILEDYYEFKGKSNIYCLNNNNVIWYAEKVSKDDVYTNLFIEDSVIYANSWNGFTVKIDVNNGKILSKEFTK